jgi:hypothetical protein
MDAEKHFADEIDCRFPYGDLDACKRLIDCGIAISPGAAFAALHEICRPSRHARVTAERLLELLDYWRSRFDHPAAQMMQEVARAIIFKQPLPVDDVIARMNILAGYPPLFPALSILYFSCDDVDERLEPIYDKIWKRWANLTR